MISAPLILYQQVNVCDWVYKIRNKICNSRHLALLCEFDVLLNVNLLNNKRKHDLTTLLFTTTTTAFYTFTQKNIPRRNASSEL